jgi:hypothetical protein
VAFAGRVGEIVGSEFAFDKILLILPGVVAILGRCLGLLRQMLKVVERGQADPSRSS